MERLTGKDELGYYAPRNITLNCLKQRGELVDRLAYYEDLEKQGRLVLPCKPGDKVYRVVRWGKGKVDIRERIIHSVEYNSAGEWVIHSTGSDVLGERVFLTREEAEAALKKE